MAEDFRYSSEDLNAACEQIEEGPFYGPLQSASKVIPHLNPFWRDVDWNDVPYTLYDARGYQPNVADDFQNTICGFIGFCSPPPECASRYRPVPLTLQESFLLRTLVENLVELQTPKRAQMLYDYCIQLGDSKKTPAVFQES